MEALKRIEEIKVVPVAVFATFAEAAEKLTALRAGGLPLVEITFRTENAAEIIKEARSAFPDMLIGAGTVINGAQAVRAIGAGAQFVVSPGFSQDAARVADEAGIPYIGGAVTPTEIMNAIRCGARIVKLFPADLYGGLKAVETLGSVFPGIRFMPTGGVNADNLKQYLLCDKIFAVGGSWMMKGDTERLAAQAASIVKEAVCG